MDTAQNLARSISDAFQLHIVEEALPRLRTCVEQLDEQQLWYRHGASGNSVGNLLLHLQGNTRQWILSGVRGDEDIRERPAEFAADGAGAPSGAQLMDQLDATAREAAAVIAALTADDYVAVRRFQGRWDRTVCGAVLHVLEHFSGHTYQIFAFTKAMRGVDLAFWDV